MQSFFIRRDTLVRRFVIKVAVADLRGQPQELTPKDYSHHPLRLSQLLYGERCELIETQKEWLYIAALEQPHYTETQGWHPYRGWVHRREVSEVEQFLPPSHVVCCPSLELVSERLTLPFGTYVTSHQKGCLTLPNGKKIRCNAALRPIPKSINRLQLIEDARLFLGAPYLWGGRGAYLHKTISSVDCSGLINLLYRAQGLQIPRDAPDQYLKSHATQQLKPGDMIYLSKEINPKRINHVMIKLDDNKFIESPETGKMIRILKEGQDLWQKNHLLHMHDRPHPCHFFFRTFLKED